jgi:hypothetical protein
MNISNFSANACDSSLRLEETPTPLGFPKLPPLRKHIQEAFASNGEQYYAASESSSVVVPNLHSLADIIDRATSNRRPKQNATPGKPTRHKQVLDMHVDKQPEDTIQQPSTPTNSHKSRALHNINTTIFHHKNNGYTSLKNYEATSTRPAADQGERALGKVIAGVHKKATLKDGSFSTSSRKFYRPASNLHSKSMDTVRQTLKSKSFVITEHSAGTSEGINSGHSSGITPEFPRSNYLPTQQALSVRSESPPMFSRPQAAYRREPSFHTTNRCSFYSRSFTRTSFP